MLQTFAASHPLATVPLKQGRSTVAADTTLFSDLQVHCFQIYKCINTDTTFSNTELGFAVLLLYIYGNVGTVS